MKIKRVEITGGELGWKGTWYKRGEQHFVQENARPASISRWDEVDVCGGINNSDAQLLTGFSNWWACLIKTARVTLQIDRNWAAR